MYLQTREIECEQQTMTGADFRGSQRELRSMLNMPPNVSWRPVCSNRPHRICDGSHGATSKIERELYFDAYRWLTVNECSSPFSFLNVCQLLNLAPDNVRHELVGDSSLGALSYWARRCGRAAGRLRTSFSHFFVNERNGHAEQGDMVFNNASSAAGACLHENVN